MSQQCEEPRFTIEQIDLLQRLRRTGMTQAEILHALDTLDRLDRKHEHKFSHRASHLSPPTTSSSSSITVTASSSTTSTATQTNFPGSRPSSSLSNNYENSPPLPPTATNPVAMVAAPQNGLVAITNGKLSPPRFPVSMVATNMAAQGYVFDTSEEDLDIDDKVEELMRRDSAVIKEEIKSFLGNRRISQAVVAQVTGISQSRISHWLLQQGSDLSEQKKRAFFRWYQLEKTNPGATLAMRAAPLGIDDMVEWHQATPPLSSTPGGFRLRRGSRFTWRKECLAVMESYFSDNQYPDEAKREEIANACNAVIQKPGKKLSDLEKVTSLKVYNWFANRRKEIKRRANIEAAILESHGIEVESPGGQSNSDEVDGNDFPDQGCEVSLFDKRAASRAFGLSRVDLSSPTQVPTLLPSWLAAWPALGRGGVAGQRGNSLIGRSLVSGAGSQAEGPRLTGVSWSPPSPSLQEEPTNHNSLTEPQDPITLAVEMAAVNHSILALANQVGVTGGGAGGDIKTEALEDD
ncbi:homeobox-containing protein 1-like [Lampris incognitus]|uniref:homeobox-containing protein 1-like n=1 Tax=Lampris incognitus TaxID=2546036 RepID=UPI0024B5E8DA|nr:homeobox-containing protein 1-like [Lampris incognitus]